MFSISDHVVIHKFAFEFFKINFNIKNNFKKTFFFDKKKSLKMFVNGQLVCPHPINLYYLVAIVKQGRVFTVYSKKNLEEYVSFTRANFTPMVKSWCDWCSIINGYCTFIISSINSYYQNNAPESIEKKPLVKLKFLMAHLGYVKIMLEKDTVFLNKTPITPADLFPEIYANSPPYLKELFEEITKCYNMFQELEHQWCPFQHMKRIASLAHTDKDRYDSYLKCEGFDDLIKAGEIIFNFKHLKCNQCVEYINTFFDNEMSASGYKLQLRTEDFFELVCRLSR